MDSPDKGFWSLLEGWVATCELVIDRAAGSRHPRYPAFRYPYDYGYLSGTCSADGQGIDVWRGSLSRHRVTAIVCTVDRFKRDAELKILVSCTESECQEICRTHNSGPQRAILIMRDP
jgi:inorganic pyrophosphatase